MGGFHMQYLSALCKRRGWSEPTYESSREPGGYTCIVEVNGRDYQTDLAYESDDLARENAAMRAFMVCRNFSVNGGMLARNGIMQGLPTDESIRKLRNRISRHPPGGSSSYYRPSRRKSAIDSSSSDFAPTDSATSRTPLSSFCDNDNLHLPMSSRFPTKPANIGKIALEKSFRSSAKSVESREQTEAYRQSLEEYGQTSASPQDLTDALEAHKYNKTQWLLERFFDQVAVGEYSWLNELMRLGFSALEITDELLEKAIQGSWIHEPFNEPNSDLFSSGLHQSNCVHTRNQVSSTEPIYTPSSHGRNIIVTGPGDRVQGENTPQPGSHGLRGDESPSKSEMENQGVTLTARQRIDYLCGLGGVRPAADGSTDLEFGSVSFDENNSRASITLNGPADNSTVIQVLDNLDRAAGEIQRLGGCCDSFSVLLDSAQDHVELQRISFETFRRLRELVLDPEMADIDGRGTDLLIDLFGTTNSNFHPTRDAGSLQHWFVVATQFLALGLLSYAQAHCGPIQPFFLDTPLQTISLLGSDKPEPDSEGHPTLVCYLVELTCMGDMIGQPVLAFGWRTGHSVEKRLHVPSVPRKDTLASPIDILDTWGPGGMVVSENDPNALYSIFVGGGTITFIGESYNIWGGPRLHWSRQNNPTTITFLRDVKDIIGTTILENDGCQAAVTRLRNSLPMLEEIGTFPSYWELMERQLGLGAQGGQAGVAILQFNQTWVKMRGTTKKSAMLSQHSIYISDLDNMFGVQVSICTGIARRVRLRDLLADLLPAYVSGLVVEPLHWKDLIGKYDLLMALRGSDLRHWLQNLDHPSRVDFEGLVFAVLYLLRDTGIDRKCDQFVIACLQSDLPFQCFKIPCKNENYWARMLIDSEESATFAYVTTQCLETAALKCSKPSPLWCNSTALLGTAVSQDRVAAAYALAASPGLGKWTLKENEAYLIGHSDKVLYVQVKTPDGLDPHLLVSLSTIPPEFLKRLFRKGKPKRLREKKCFDSCAESVVVCVEKTVIDTRS